MDELIDFLSQVAQNPQLAIALLVETMLQAAWMPLLATGIVAGCGFVAVKRWRRRKRKQDDMELHELVMLSEPHASEIDEDTFLAWYEDRMEASDIIVSEDQARRLYQAYKDNEQIILRQRGSEVAN